MSTVPSDAAARTGRAGDGTGEAGPTMNSLFGVYLVERGLATPSDIVRALDRQRQRQVPLGTLALRNRFLTMKQVFAVLNSQSENRRRFGDIARDLGYLTDDQLHVLLAQQASSRPMLGELLVDMGVLDERSMQAVHDAFKGRETAPCSSENAAVGQ